MSAIFGALALFYALAFVTITVAFASDSLADLRSSTQRAAMYPSDAMTDDERILTTVVAAAERPSAAATDSPQDASKVAHAA
jgi:phosphoribosylaminoimidazole carboxylase (NCAIR synthetase)